MYAQIYEYNPLSLFFVINMYNTMFYNIYIMQFFSTHPFQYCIFVLWISAILKRIK